MKRTLSLLLTLILCISLLPVTAFAADEELPETLKAIKTEIPEENEDDLNNGEQGEFENLLTDAGQGNPENLLTDVRQGNPENLLTDVRQGEFESLLTDAEVPEISGALTAEKDAEAVITEDSAPDAEAIISATPELDILTEKNFPDASLLQSLREQFPEGLTAKEALETTYLSVQAASDITGLRLFPNLIVMELSIGNPVNNTLDLSGFEKLESIRLDNGNMLCSLNMSGCVSLNSLYVMAAYLESVDLSGCASLTDLNIPYSSLKDLNLSGCTSLKTLTIKNGDYKNYYREIAVLDLSECTALESLTASGNIKSINFGTNENFKNLELHSNLQMQTLDLSGLPNLESLNIEDCGLTWLDLRNNPNVTNAQMTQNNSVLYGTPSDNNFLIDMGEVMPEYGFSRMAFSGGVDFDAAAGIVTVPSGTEQITYTYQVYGGRDMTVTASIINSSNILTHANFPDPNFLDTIVRTLGTNYLTKEQASEITSLFLGLDLYVNDITGLEYFTGLDYLDISMPTPDYIIPRIETVDLSAQTKLTGLTFNNVNFGEFILKGNNELQSFMIFPGSTIDHIQISDCGNLRTVSLNEISVKSISVSNCGALGSINVFLGECKSAQVASCPVLDQITFDNCGLEELQVTDCYMVRILTLRSNPLKTLDLSFTGNLESLNVDNTALTELDLHNNLKLSDLSCRGIGLKELNLLYNTNLQELYCSDNELSELTLTNNKKLRKLSCENNHLAWLDLSANTALSTAVLSPQQINVNALCYSGQQKKCIYMDMFLPFERLSQVKSVDNGELDRSNKTMATLLNNEAVEYTILTGNSAFPEMSVSAVAPAALVITYRDFESTLPPFPRYIKSTNEFLLQAPTTTRLGADFSGWYLDTAYTKSADSLSAAMTGNIILYPYYIMHIYSVEFFANGGSGQMDGLWDIECGTYFRLPKNTFTRLGYVFDSWNTRPDGTGNKYSDNIMVSNLSLEDGDIVDLYAQWKLANFTIRFDGNGSTSGTMTGNTMICDPDTTYTLPANAFKKRGYLFANWNTKADGTGESFADCSSIRNLYNADGSDITLYAIWTNQYTVSFDKNGGSGSMNAQTHTLNTYQTLPTNTFTREGYDFIGWGLDPDDTSAAYTDGQKVRNLTLNSTEVTLYALWQETEPTTKETEITSDGMLSAEKADGGDPLLASFFSSGNIGWIAACLAVLIAAVIVIIIVKKKKKNK